MPRTRTMTSTRDGRLVIRVDAGRKAIIAGAAEQQGMSINDFVLEQAYQMASELMADEGNLTFTKKQCAEIFAVLDHPPPASVTALRNLLNLPSVFDG